MTVIRIPESVPDKQKSIFWLKRITSYVISNILYLRNFFDEESFLAIPYETTKLRILSTKSSNKNVLSIIEMLEDCFKTLEKNCLKSISIGIFGMDEHGVSKNAVETYTFDYENLTFERSDRRNRKYSDLKTQTSQTFNNLIESLSKMVPLSKGPYYLLFKMAHFEEFQPEEEGIQHFEPSTQSTHDESLFSISESVLSASFSSGSINSNFHQMSINIEAAMASNVKQDKLSSQAKNEIYVPSSDNEDEESENPGENQIKRKATRGKPSTRGKGGRSGARQPLGLLNIGKRMNNQDGEEDDGLPMPKRRVPYISQNEDEDD